MTASVFLRETVFALGALTRRNSYVWDQMIGMRTPNREVLNMILKEFCGVDLKDRLKARLWKQELSAPIKGRDDFLRAMHTVHVKRHQTFLPGPTPPWQQLLALRQQREDRPEVFRPPADYNQVHILDVLYQIYLLIPENA